MTQPHITCLCLTYGRVSHLEEAIQCFLNQDYEGPRELLVYNTFLPQKLVGDFPNVRIINAERRPANLGQCRNEAIKLAKDGWIVIADDDDLALSNHLSNFAKGFTDGVEWVWQSHQFSMYGYCFKSIIRGTCNVMAFTKKAWAQVDGYPQKDCGEDRDLVSRITQSLPGSKVPLAANEVSFAYCWQNAVFHTSGEGDDVPGRKSGHDRIDEFTRAEAAAGRIPTGEILLKPRLTRDYTRMAREFVKNSTQTHVIPPSFKGILAGHQSPYAPDTTKLHPLPKITLVYVTVPGDDVYTKLAGEFATTYVKCPPGLPHDTIVIANGGNANDVCVKLYKLLPKTTVFRWDNSGWDIGAFLAVSKVLTDSDVVVYCGGKTHFKRGGWLIRMIEAWKKLGPGFYGATSSYEVSPHINTSGFWCSPELLRQYPIKVTSRQDRYNFEHGPLACWRFAVKLGLPARLVTWEGEYDWAHWREPQNIFRSGDQSNCLAYFEHTRRFDEEGPEMRAEMTRLTNTITDPYFIRALKNRDYTLTGVDERGQAYFEAKHVALDWNLGTAKALV